LIERCRENDRDAQFELYKIYYRQMYNTSLRIVNNTAEAEDIMQDSFLDAFRKIGDYTGQGDFGGWLRRIVVNNSLDALKKRKQEVSLEDRYLGALEAEKDESAEDVEYRIDEIKRAIGLLSNDYRVIISLLLFEGYDHEEISQILGISYAASRTRYSRARQKLLSILAERRTMKMINPN
jgi:RNA polymerase sigma-70 factor (ECF subfamily)